MKASRNWFEKLTAAIVRAPYLVLILALVPTGLSLWSALEIPLHTSRKALLPQDVDVSQRLESYLTRFGAASDLMVVVEGANRQQREQFADQLSARLLGEESISQAVCRLDLGFFLEHLYLLLPEAELLRIEAAVSELNRRPAPPEKAGWDQILGGMAAQLDEPPPLSGVDMDLRTAEASLSSVAFFLGEWLRYIQADSPPTGLGFHRLAADLGGGSIMADRGYFASHDGGMLFVFVRAADPSEEYNVIAPFIHTVRRVGAALQNDLRSQGRPVPEFGLTGLPAITYEEFTAIGHDIVLTVVSALILIALLILVWLRSLGWALVVFVPMGLGVLWNVGLTYLLVGHLTMITAAFTAILFGLGIDYGIFMSTRVMEERTQGKDLSLAIVTGVSASARALLTAGGATVLIFAALIFVPFSGFASMGKVAAGGVVLVLVSTFLLQPALFILLPPRLSRLAKSKSKPKPLPAASGQMKRSGPVHVFLVSAGIALAGMGVMAGISIPFDYDVLSLLPKDSESARLQRRMLKESDYQGEVIIFTAKTMAEARRITQQAAALPSLSRVQSVTEFFPEDAQRRADWARKLAAMLDRSAWVKKFMSLPDLSIPAAALPHIETTLSAMDELMADAQELAFSAGHAGLVARFETILTQLESLQAILEKSPARLRKGTEDFCRALLGAVRHTHGVLSAWKQARPLTAATLPAMLRDRFIGKDGSFALYGFPAHSVYDLDFLQELLRDVYAVSDQATGFPTTHLVFARMAVDSFRQGSLSALLAAILWIGLLLRRPRLVLIALLPLLVGGGWMLGVLWLIGLKLSFANIVALPLVMGLAVDYGVWYAHRRRELHPASSWQVARVAGRAILLAAGTTLAGLGAVTMAQYQGVATMGISVTVGLVCCVVAALLISPAASALLIRRDKP